MTDRVQRLKDELSLEEALVPLEKAREAMHANRNAKTIAAYKVECDRVTKVRQAFRTKYPPAQAPGDGVAAPATVEVKAGVERP